MPPTDVLGSVIPFGYILRLYRSVSYSEGEKYVFFPNAVT